MTKSLIERRMRHMEDPHGCYSMADRFEDAKLMQQLQDRIEELEAKRVDLQTENTRLSDNEVELNKRNAKLEKVREAVQFLLRRSHSVDGFALDRLNKALAACEEKDND